ncbi:MAG: hypothetical protein Q8L48_22615 [Archangium sp.]|nr:hypothetical protein [Archangium sp.]
MNRRALAWLSAAVVAIVTGAWWLSAEVAAPLPVPVVVPLVVPPPPVAIAAPPAPTPSPEPVDAAVAKEPLDAGRLAEVEIEVYDDGVRQVGIRVQLEGPGGQREGRPLDIMGVARFTLVEGSWRVTAPARRNVSVVSDGGNHFDELRALALARTTPFEVRAPVTHLRLDLARRRTVRGQVLDVKGRPVAGAAIDLIQEVPRTRDLDLAIRLRGTAAVTDAVGRFEFEADTESVVIQAWSGNSRSLPRLVKAPGERTLVLEPWTLLQVKVVGAGNAPACLRVTRRGEFVAEGSSDRPIEVPEGAVDIFAIRSAWGRAYSGRTEATRAEVEDGEALVRLKAVQPIRGRLVDASGWPVPGVTVSVGAVDPASAEMLPDGGVVWPPAPRAGASAVSGRTGEFSLTAAACDDPTWLVMAGGAWRTTRQVLVGLDDAPLEVPIEPVPQ